MNHSFSSVVKVIKNYVCTSGGDVTLPELEEDYRTAFNCDIPFKKFGHANLIDFLISITGITVVIHDGEYHIKSKWSKSLTSSRSSSSKSSSSDSMTMLSVEMPNNPIPNSNSKRKVTVKPSGPYTNYENEARERYNSSYDIKIEDYSDLTYSDPVKNRFSTSVSPCHNLDLSSLSRDLPSSSPFDLNGYTPVDENLSISPSNYYSHNSKFGQQYTSPTSDYYSQDFDFQRQHTPLSNDSFNYDFKSQQLYNTPLTSHDSSSIRENRLAAADSYVNDRNDYFSRQLPSANNNGFYSLFDTGGRTNFDFLKPPPEQPPVSEKQVLNRLVALVNANQEKIASSAVEFNYMDSYSDALPKNWLTLLEESNLLYIERLTAGATIYPNRTFTSAPTILDLPKIDLPRQMPWPVEITNIRSTDCLWFRLKVNDFESRYQILCREMRKYYQDMVPGQVTFIKPNQLFVVKLKGKPIRVCVLRNEENELCKCLAIDEGIEEMFPVRSLIALHEKFTNTPKLISLGTLVGLRQYADCSHITRKLEKIMVGMESSVVVEKFDGKFTINLFVTRAHDSASVNVNEYMLDVVKKELNLPKFEVNGMHDIILLSLDNNIAKVQIKSPCLELLQESLRMAKHIIDCTDKRLLFAKNCLDIQLNKRYLAQYVDGSWQRVWIQQFYRSTHVVVDFVDLLDIQVLEVTKIIRYADFPDVLFSIPSQGVSVQVVETDREVLKLMNSKLKTNSFSMKIVKVDPKLCVRMYFKVPEERPNGNLGLFGFATA